MSEDKYYCLECSVELHEDYEPEMCCNGRDCGCMGMPTSPPFCHDKSCCKRYNQRNKLKYELTRAKATLGKISKSNNIYEIHKRANRFLNEKKAES